MRSAVLSFCICFRFCSGKESCRTQKQTSENHISSYLRASYCFLLSFFTFVSFFYKAKPSMKTAHTEITFLLLFTPFSVTRFAMHRIYANRINSRGISRVFCDLRSQKTPRGILPVNSNELFHITVHPDVHFFQGMGNILIPERSSGQISIQPSHLSFIKLCVRRIFLFDRPA